MNLCRCGAKARAVAGVCLVCTGIVVSVPPAAHHDNNPAAVAITAAPAGAADPLHPPDSSDTAPPAATTMGVSAAGTILLDHPYFGRLDGPNGLG
jgi:hypothetical protein